MIQMTSRNPLSGRAAVCFALTLAIAVLAPLSLQAQDFTSEFHCEDFSTVGSNPFLPLWPGLQLVLRGEEDGEEIEAIHTILYETRRVAGVLTRVIEERESEDGELTEISRNFVAHCRQTGDVWYFGEDVDDYEDGEIVGHDGAWLAGVDGATPGILMPGSPILGARYYQEIAPGVALDQGQIISLGEEVVTPFGTFNDTLGVLDTDELDPGPGDPKFYARGLGNIVDEVLRLEDVTLPACIPDATTHCVVGGRFKVEADWVDFNNGVGAGKAIMPSDSSGDFWFFSPDNTELIVKVLDACHLDSFNSFFVFAAGTTNVGVTLTITDMATGLVREYTNDLGSPFEPVLDTGAFFTCDSSPELPPGNDDDSDEDEDSDEEDSDEEDSDGEDSDGEDSDGEDSDGEDSDEEEDSDEDEDSDEEDSDEEDSDEEDSEM